MSNNILHPKKNRHKRTSTATCQQCKTVWLCATPANITECRRCGGKLDFALIIISPVVSPKTSKKISRYAAFMLAAFCVRHVLDGSPPHEAFIPSELDATLNVLWGEALTMETKGQR